MCAVCALKIGLTPQNNQRFLIGDFEMAFQCPECRDMMAGDVRLSYYRVLHRMEEFSKEQQEMLMILKAMDPAYEKASARLENEQKQIQEMCRKQFRKKCNIQIVGPRH